jgi:hypothetical protein
VIGSEDLNSRTDGCTFPDEYRLNVQNDAIEVQEGPWAERNVVAVIAKKGRAYKGFLANRREPLNQ